MTREQYILYRTEGNFLMILYQFFLEEKGTLQSFEQFKVLIHKWLLNISQQHFMKTKEFVTTDLLYEQLFDSMILHYDTKFNIVYMKVEKETKVKESKTFII